jgi:hypothetical protein
MRHLDDVTSADTGRRPIETIASVVDLRQSQTLPGTALGPTEHATESQFPKSLMYTLGRWRQPQSQGPGSPKTHAASGSRPGGQDICGASAADALPFARSAVAVLGIDGANDQQPSRPLALTVRTGNCSAAMGIWPLGLRRIGW